MDSFWCSHSHDLVARIDAAAARSGANRPAAGSWLRRLCGRLGGRLELSGSTEDQTRARRECLELCAELEQQLVALGANEVLLRLVGMWRATYHTEARDRAACHLHGRDPMRVPSLRDLLTRGVAPRGVAPRGVAPRGVAVGVPVGVALGVPVVL